MKRLEHFPVGLFATVMGVAGLSLAWRRAHLVLGAPSEIGVALAFAATALWVVLALGMPLDGRRPRVPRGPI